MRVLIVGSDAWYFRNFRSDLVADVKTRGHAVDVVISGGSETDTAALEALGVGVFRVTLNRTGYSPLSDMLSLKGYHRVLRETGSELVLAFGAKPVIFSNLAAWRLRGIQSFALITGLGQGFLAGKPSGRWMGFVLGRLYGIALRRAAGVIFQNEDDRRFFVNSRWTTFGRSHVVNGSGVNLEWFVPTAGGCKPVTFLLMSRLIENKGIREYASAARTLKMFRPEVRFWLLGIRDANRSAISVEEVQTWSKAGAPEYLGELRDVRAVLGKCSVYVLPSCYPEGIPRSILEAMAMGKAVITTDAPGCRETVIDGRNGFLVPCGDVDALARAMRRFIDEPRLGERMGIESRKIAEERFDVRKVNARMIEIMGL